MKSGYDGTIRFDTKVDPKGFNEGVNKLSLSMDKVMKVIAAVFQRILIGVAVAVAAIALIGVAFGFVIGMVIKFSKKLTESLYKSLSSTSAFRDQVVELKTAFDALDGAGQALGASLLNAIAPVLLKIIDWLVEAINWVSMFIASLAGQKTVMQYVSGSTSTAANSTGKLVKNTKDLKKAAEGALAAFDEINVLQMEKAEESGGGGGATGGNIVLKEVAVPDNFVKSSWESFKTWMHDSIITPIGNWFSELYADIGQWLLDKVITPVAGWLAEAFTNITNPAWWDEKFQELAQWADGIVQWLLENFFRPIGNFFNEKLITPIAEGIGALINSIKNAFESLKTSLQTAWSSVYGWFRDTVINPIRDAFSAALTAIKGFFTTKLLEIQNLWGTAEAWFQTSVTEPIKNAFFIALDAIESRFETVFNNIKNFMKNVVNTIIDFLNGMLHGIVMGINAAINALNSIHVTIPEWIPMIGGKSWGMSIPTVTAPQIPRLATGAVIPPNAAFAAVLGDQSSGKNLEAPEGLIRQIMQEELGNIKTDVEIKFGGSLGALIRELKPYIDKENTRIGSSLVGRVSQ